MCHDRESSVTRTGAKLDGMDDLTANLKSTASSFRRSQAPMNQMLRESMHQ
jgi:hypothetical protein